MDVSKFFSFISARIKGAYSRLGKFCFSDKFGYLVVKEPPTWTCLEKCLGVGVVW